MVKKKEVGFLGKASVHAAIGLVVVVGLLALPRPAKAADAVFDVVTEAETTLIAASDAITAAAATVMEATGISQLLQMVQDEMDAAFDDAIDTMQHWIDELIETQIADVNNVNARNNVNVRTAQDIQVRYYLPQTYSTCRIAQGARARDMMNSADNAVAKAWTNSLISRYNDPATVSAYAADRYKVGLGICSDRSSVGGSTMPTQAALGKALDCQVQWGGKHEGDDGTDEALFDSGYQFPIPENYFPPYNRSGLHLAMPQPATEKYMPYVAALSFCMTKAPLVPPPPAAAKGYVTASTIAVAAAFPEMESAAGVALSMCMKYLAERTQYGANVRSEFKDLHDGQVIGCMADYKKNLIDDVALADCQRDGRSSLQARHDRSYRAKSERYHNMNRVGALGSDMSRVDDVDDALQDKFDDHVEMERAQLTQATQAAKGVPTVASSLLDRVVK